MSGSKKSQGPGRFLLGWALALALGVGSLPLVAAPVPVLPPAVASGAETRLEATQVLRAGPLRVEVMDPNHPARYNRGERFSPVANVLRVSLGGVDFLHAPAEHDPITDNGGLAMEFDNAKFGPPGFVEAPLGGSFLKIGVGALRKSADLYHYMARQEVVAPAVTTVEWRASGASFRQTCPEADGYGYALSSEVEARPDSVEISYRLENTGRRPFATRQYAHNYFSLGQDSVGPGFEVEFPFDFDAVGAQPGWRQEGRVLRLDSPVEDFVNITVPILYHYLGENRLVARHRPSGRAIVATTSLLGPQVFVHARPRYLSPEQFVVLKLAPGESAAWSRRYVFILDERAPAPVSAR